jgi:ATP-dependent DNA helicase RecG
MALPTNIHTLLSGNVVEWARIEFKESWKPEASLKTITAFANDIDNWGGGYLIIGVEEDENGRPKRPFKGLKLTEVDKVMKDLLNKCRLISPDYLPIVQPVDNDNNTKILIVWCPGGPVRPYSSPTYFTYEKGIAKASDKTTCWIRKMASTVKPSDQDMADLYSLANRIPFDDQTCHAADMTDLNITLIRAYLKEIGSDLYEESATMDFNQLCSEMEISNSLPEYTKPRNAGLLFFSLNPEKYIKGARIDIVEFLDGDGGDKIEEHIFRGPLHQQLRDALRYISNNIIQEKIVKHPDRAEADRYFNYPFPAIEEALANAVYHKAYNVDEPIEVRVETDRIDILSYPGPDRSVSVDALKTFNVLGRKYRNRRIGDYLKELHLTEGRNTGFRKILKALKNNGSPLPEFITDDEHTFFVSRIYIREGFNDAEPEYQDISEKQLENTGKQLENTEKQLESSEKQLEIKPETAEMSRSEKIATRQNNILMLIRKDPSISQISLALKLELSEMEIRTAINKLKSEGTIHREGPERGGCWVIDKR